MNYARTFENGSFPPIHLSITMLRPALITRVPHRGVPKGTPSPIGNHPGPCYGFTENVHIPSLSDLFATNFSWVDSWLWEEYSQVCFPSVERCPNRDNGSTSSVIIRDIKSIFNDRSTLLAYFYFDFKDTAKQNSHALLSSLLVQLSDQSDILCDILFSLYSAHKLGSEQPTDDSLAQCLEDMLAITGQAPIYLIIDALDECPNDSGIPSSREKVLRLVKDLVGLHHPNLRLCITSRPEFDIRTTLKPLATQQLSLHDESGQKQDIIDYVTSIVRLDERMKKWRDDDKTMVIGKLTEKADGM